MDKKRLDKDSKKAVQNSKASVNDILNKSDLKFLELLTEHLKVIEHLKQEYNLSLDQIIKLALKQQKPSKDEIPISVFGTKALSCLEIVVKYLKENLSLSFCDIAKKLNRDQRTIWATYNNSRKKYLDPLVATPSKYFISISIFSDRKFSALESLVLYLSKNLSLRIIEISRLLRKDHSTIWTVLSRAKKKEGVHKNA